jgi:BON domain
MRSDSDIRRHVEDELRWDPEIDPTDIAVSVNNGVVTLIGFVRSHPERHLAEAATKRVAGVLAVANDPQVRLPDMDQRPDPEIRSRRHCTDQERTAVCMGKYPGGSEECSAYAGRRSRMELPGTERKRRSAACVGWRASPTLSKSSRGWHLRRSDARSKTRCGEQLTSTLPTLRSRPTAAR